MADGATWWCQHCKRELEPSHTGPCPYCGKSGKEGEETGAVIMRAKVGGEAVHETHLSPQGWPILTLLTGLAVGAADILILALISQWYRYPVVIAVTIAIVLLMLKLRGSYRFITLCRYLDRTASGKRRFK